METFSHLTRFLFASRHASHMIEPLRSRCMMLELEPMCPADAYPMYLDFYNIPMEARIPAVLNFCVRNFIVINDIKSIIKLYKASITDGKTPKEALAMLGSLLSTSNNHIQNLVSSLGQKNGAEIREAITNLYLNGYLLDDILLGIERAISIFPSTNPVIRFTILQFTMLGWISIQQGKEHWLDTMDIVEQVLR